MRSERLRILLVAASIDRKMAGRAAIHLHHAREVHIVDDVRRDDLAHGQRRRHEVEQRRIAEVVLDEARFDIRDYALQAVLLEVDLIDLFLQSADLRRVFAQLGLQRGALCLDFLHFEVELVQPLGFGLDFLLCLADALGILRPLLFECVAIDVVSRLGELRRLVSPEEAPVHLGQPIVDVVDALAIRFHRLLRRAKLVRQPGELGLVDAPRVLRNLLPRHLELELGELPLRVLPLAIEVVPHHPQRRDEQKDAGRGKDDVQEVDVIGVPDSLFFSHNGLRY